MILNPFGSGFKWKPIPFPDGITWEHLFDNLSRPTEITYRFKGLTKENIKKGCWLVAYDNTGACVLYVHEDGKIEMFTGGDGKFSLSTPTVSNATIEVVKKDFTPNFGYLAIGLE